MDEIQLHPSPRRKVWLISGGAVALALLIAAPLWFASGNKIWTDGNSIRVADRDTKIREVIWTKPLPLEGFASDEQIYEPSVSPDGTELYFVRGKAGRNARIFVSYRHNNAWTAPVSVDSINGPFDSLGPRVTPDGNLLLFYSDRPGGFGGYDIWAAPRMKDGWGKPFNLGPHVNSEFNEFNPDPTPDGRHLIFATNRKAARREQREAWRSTIRETVSSDYDLWITDADFSLLPHPTGATRPTTQPAPQVNLAFRPPREIDGINTPYSEGASCMSPLGDFLYFASNRPGGFGKFDIYRSQVRGDHFGEPENVGPSINSSENEADPALAYNGFRMYFSSDRPGADRRYHLLVSDSREVYPERLARPMPHLGWSWLVLLISLLVLIPLLMFLRGWDERRLSVIQKCLLLSLLVHALITFILSFVVVTQKVTQFVRAQSELEVAVNLREGQGVEESLAIRNQVSNDLPVSGAAPAAMSPARAAQEPMEAIKPVDVAMTGERIAPAHMTIAADAPAPAASVPDLSRTEVAAAAAPTDGLDLKLPSAGGISHAESDPDPSPVKSAGEKSLVTESAPATPGGAGPSNLSIAAAPLTQKPAPTDLPIASGQKESGVQARLGDAASTGPLPFPQIGSTGTTPQLGEVHSSPVAAAAEAAPAPARSSAVPAKSLVDHDPALAGGSTRAPETIQLPATPAGAPSTRPSVQPAGFRSPQEGIATLVPSTSIPPAVGRTAPGPENLTATPSVTIKADGRPEAVSSPTMAASTMAPSRAGLGDVQVPHGAINLDTSPDTATAELKPHSLAVAPAPRAGVAPLGPSNDSVPSPNAVTSGIPGPQIGGLNPGNAVASNIPPAGEKSISTQAPGITLGPTEKYGESPARIVDITPSPILAAAPIRSSVSDSSVPDQPANRPVEVTASAIQPQIEVSTLAGPLGPTGTLTPDLTVIRAPEARKPLLQQFGGTPESENAVERGLAYLARMQQRDGYWTRIESDERPDDNARGRHDMACTSLALLAFLGHDHTPDKPGPYRDAVARAVNWLIDQQDSDGDLRGIEQFRGGGADSANMYDQGIATYALAECAIMTHDPRTIEAAVKGARFIVKSQNRRSGGWRYSPNEYGDSSVFGWQVMALHSAEQVGFEIPQGTINAARRYIESCGQGRHRLLAGYQPHEGPTSAMTAELLFARMLLDMPLDEEGVDEATRFLARNPPDVNNADLYYWYYASLSMLHMHNPLWKDWNVLTRESLIQMQEKNGPARGCWNTNVKWGDRGGRVFTTSLATLTLEVYYRYLPLRKGRGEN